MNPFKVFKAARTGYRAYKACKYAKKARSYVKKGKALKKIKLKARHTKITKKKYKVKRKPKVVRTSKKTIKKLQRKAKAMCFTAGTRIHTEKGFKAIETIKPGDRVWSENPETNSKALKKVKKIFVREKDSLIRLAINGEVIETTDEHPFYVEGRGFTAAKELKAGDEVRLEDGTAARIESSETRQLDRPVKVYNFEVEDYHTYYVSEQKVLVHNTCSKPTEKKTPAKLNERYNTSKRLYRVMSEGELKNVKETGQLRGGRKGTTYFTDSRYKNAEVAQDRLSLPEKPDFILEFEITNNPIIKGGSRVEPNYGGKGGGREYFTDDIVDIKIINYQKMVPGGRYN